MLFLTCTKHAAFIDAFGQSAGLTAPRPFLSKPSLFARPDSPVSVLRSWWGAAVFTAALAGLAGAAAAEPYNPGRLTSDQLARVSRVCESVIRVPRGEAHYDGCVKSLSDSLRGARQIADATPGSAAGVFGPAVGVSSTSYFYASADEVRRRAALSCLRLGLDQERAEFAGCVASLSATLRALDMPPVT